MTKSPLRILYVSHLHPPKNRPLENLGGMQRVSMQLKREFERRKDIHLDSIILHAPWKGIGWYTAGFLAKLITTLPKKIRHFDADVVLFSSMVTASTALLIRSRVSVPLVTITHGQDVTLPSKIYQGLVPAVFRRIDGVIAVSSATKEACVERGMKSDKVRALANGFDKKDQDIYPEYEVARNEIADDWNLDLEQSYLLLTVGRLVKRKGHERFIRRVLPSIKKTVHYLIIGDGPEYNMIEKAIEDTGQSNRVTLAGRQPDEMLRSAYAASDLFIMPNIPVEGDMEGFGIVLLEANLAETPAVASDLEGIKDVIEEGQNGYRIKPEDNQAFSAKIDGLISEGNLRNKGRQARQFVIKHFSWEKVAGAYIEFLREIVQRSKIT